MVSKLRGVSWFMLLAGVACHRVSPISYVAPPAGDREPALGRLDPAVANLVRASYVRQTERGDAPVTLAPTDGSELELRVLDASVAIDGPLAHTELHFTFHNAESRQREGRFTIALPTDAAVGRFAMKTAGGWREARIVAREEARDVYERFLHHKTDPALLEQDDGNQFSARVFPIAPNEDKEIIIAYDHRVSAAEPYTLALHGLPKLSSLSVAIDHDGDHREVDEHDRAPDDIAIGIAPGIETVAAGEAFVARIDVAQPMWPMPLDHVMLLVDTSASRAPVMGRQASVVRALLAAMAPQAEVSIATFDQEVNEVYRGPASEAAVAVDRLLDHGALGASDLGAALTRAASAGMSRVIVIGDGLPTLGETEPAKLGALVAHCDVQRIDAVQVGQTIDRDTFAVIVHAGAVPGVIVDGRDPAHAARQLVVEVPAEHAITVDGATSVWPPTTRGVGPGDPVWVFGLRAAADAGKPLVAHVGGTTFALAVRGAEPARVARAVARARIADLERQMELATGSERAAIAKQVETVALENKLISSQTSLLVLETDYDEHRFLDAPLPNAPNAPIVDPGSPTQGITIDQQYLKNIPVPGRTFDAVLGAAAGNQKDAVGASFSGSSSLENQYIVDGVNTTGLTMGASSCCAGAAVESPAEPTYAQPYVGVMRDIMQSLARRDRGRALHLASKWELDSPGEIAAIIALGEALEARGAYALAARAYGSIIDLYPKRAELLRAAGERLDRVDGARAVAIDAYRRALRERPDQASTYRLLAYDLMREDNPEALDIVFDGMKHADRPSIHDIFMNDSGLIASYLLVHAPAKRAYIQARVRTALPTRPSLQIVLSWETDANDVDLHVRDARGGHSFYNSPALLSGGRLLDDVTTGFGPEMFEVEAPAAFPYHLGVHYYARGPEGVGLGTVQVIRYDGAGGISIDNRPFVIQNDQAMVDLGVVE